MQRKTHTARYFYERLVKYPEESTQKKQILL